MTRSPLPVGGLGLPNLSVPGRVVVSVDSSTWGFNPCDPGTLMMSSMLVVYGSTVDDRTGDAVFSLGQVQWQEYTDTCGSPPNEGCDTGGQGIRLVR